MSESAPEKVDNFSNVAHRMSGIVDGHHAGYWTGFRHGWQVGGFAATAVWAIVIWWKL